MAHFAQMNGNAVGQIIVIANEVLNHKDFPESEPIGIAFCKSLYGEDTDWLQVSYNGNFRGMYPGSGMTYDSITDTFQSPNAEG